MEQDTYVQVLDQSSLPELLPRGESRIILQLGNRLTLQPPIPSYPLVYKSKTWME